MPARSSLPHTSLFLLFLWACGGDAKPAQVPTTPGTASTTTPPVSKAAGSARPLGNNGAFIAGTPRRHRPLTRAHLATAASERPSGSMGSSDYDKIGPATVYIEDGNGSSGSGVVIGKEGYVLTNYHVVAGGTFEGLHLRVNVQIGKLAPPEGEKETKLADGNTNLVMSKSGTPYKAWVHAFDMVNDIAVLKIEAPAGQTLNLPALPIAATDAPVGSTVHCMGHPGIGGLWTLREGKVETVRDDVDLLARVLGAGDDRDNKDLVEQVKQYESQSGTGRLLQVSCPFVHGESGGPEVNGSGEIIGINRRYDKDDSGHIRFGVPSSAIRRLVAAVSASPVDVIPDPWRDGGQIASLSDASLNGVPDTLSLKGFSFFNGQAIPEQSAFLIDPSEQAISGSTASVMEIRKKKTLKNRFSLVHDGIGDRLYTMYDTNDDGKPDVVFLESGSDLRGFRIENGAARADASLGTAAVSSSLFPAGAERERLDAILGSLGLAEATSTEPIDPLKGGGAPARLSDLDGDGKPETLTVLGPYSGGFLVDASESFFGKYKAGADDAKSLKLDSAPVDLSFVTADGGRAFLYASSKAPGKLDLRLNLTSAECPTVDSATMLDGSAAPSDAVGRKAIRPGLFPPASWERIKKLNLRAVMVGADDGIGSFPNAAEDVSAVARFKKKGFEKKILMGSGDATTTILIDVDGDSWNGKKDASALDLVSNGQAKPELVEILRGNHAWVLYDTDKDGNFDVVLYADNDRSVDATLGYRIDPKTNKVTLDSSLARRKLVGFSLFKGAVAGQMKSLLASSKIFEEGTTEPLK